MSCWQKDSYVIQGGHSNRVRPARARKKIRTIVHNTYKRVLIQNSIVLARKHNHNTKNNTTSSTETPTMNRDRHMKMKLPPNKQHGQGRKNTTQNRSGNTIPQQVVLETVISGCSQSQTSSIGIGEFGMNPAHRGNAAAFSMAVKDNLFPKLKFLQGTNASLDFSMDPTSICGFMQVCCGVSEADAYQWWDDHHSLLKTSTWTTATTKLKCLLSSSSMVRS